MNYPDRVQGFSVEELTFHLRFLLLQLKFYSNVRWYVYIIQITANVVCVKELVIVAEIYTTFKDNSNM